MLKRVLKIVLVTAAILVIMPLHAGKGGGWSTVETARLTDIEIEYITFMREEEKLARDVYITLGPAWGQTIFENIATSEQQHMDAMKTVIGKYGLIDPVVDENDVGSFVNDELDELYPVLVKRGEQSPYQALMVGALIEEVDMEDIQLAIDATNRKDIKAVYEGLLCGSRNHLRAFVAQIESDGLVYESQLYPDDAEWTAFIESVINSPMERTCGARRR